MRILKYILLFILLFESGISFAQTYNPTGTANLQRAPTAKGYIYRNNMGALGNVNWYTNLQIDSLINIAIGSGVTSFNSRTGVVIPLIGDYSAFYEVLSHKVQNPLDSSTTNYFSTAAVQQRLRLNPLYINPFTGHGTLADPYNLITTGAVTNGSSTVITSGGVYNAFLNYTPTSSNNLQAVTNVGNTTTLGISSLNYTLTGTAGTGYMILPTQSVLPSNPASGNHAIFTNTAGQFTILGSNGNAISFSRSVLTASRVLTAPDSSGRIALESRIIPNSNLQNSTISGVALGGNLANLTATDATLTFSGTYNGSTARTIGVNTANQFNWTNLHTFQQTLTASSGTDYGMKIIDTYNQTSTAGGTDLLINRIEGVKGSGTHRILDVQLNSSTVFNVDRGGNTLVQGVLTTNTGITNTGVITLTGRLSANFAGSNPGLISIGNTAYSIGGNAFGAVGTGLHISALTATSTSSTNTASSTGFNFIGQPTLVATNSQTIPFFGTLYIEDIPNASTGVTITNPANLILGNSNHGGLGFKGSISGMVSLKSAATAGTWALTLPTTGGTNGYFLQTDGTGISTWSQVNKNNADTSSATALLPKSNLTPLVAAYGDTRWLKLSGGNLNSGAQLNINNGAIANFGTNQTTDPSSYWTSTGLKVGTSGNLTHNYTGYNNNNISTDNGTTAFTLNIPQNTSGTFALTSQLTSGTVTSVTSANSDIGIATGTTTPVLTFNRVLANGVTATTQTQGDNSTKLATTAYVDANFPKTVASTRVTAQTTLVSVGNIWTVGASDGSFTISANVLVTTSTLHSFGATCTYVDESNTSRVLTLNFSQLTGTFITAITNGTGASAYEGVPVHIRAKAGTQISVATAGTFTSVTYNAEWILQQTN